MKHKMEVIIKSFENAIEPFRKWAENEKSTGNKIVLAEYFEKFQSNKKEGEITSHNLKTLILFSEAILTLMKEKLK